MISVHVENADEIDFSSFPSTAHPEENLRWLRILKNGLKHRPYLIRAFREGVPVGELPVVLVSGPIFGSFLVSLSYINSGGVRAADPDAQKCLIDTAVTLTDELNCRYLELRHEIPIEHARFNAELSSKVHMRLDLPATVSELRALLKAKVRNQVKKSEAQGFLVEWGGVEFLPDFYQVFAKRMRELGTPVYSQNLFVQILSEFSGMSEICRVRDGNRTIAAAILIHGDQTTEVPSAATLISYNKANANMLMYWNLLSRSIERGQATFDFGRSTLDSPTYKFKKQWGAKSYSAHWQYYLRQGSVNEMRPDSGKKTFLIETWKYLPLWVTKLLGPFIVRGIP